MTGADVEGAAPRLDRRLEGEADGADDVIHVHQVAFLKAVAEDAGGAPRSEGGNEGGQRRSVG